MTKKITAFPYYGGKYKHLRHLLPLLGTPHDVYCEAFCGSAAVALNKTLTRVNVCSDANGELINFFRVLRTRWVDLKHVLSLTPYSAQELINAHTNHGVDELERARTFLIRACMARGGMLDSDRLKRTGKEGGTRADVWRRKWSVGLDKVVETAIRYEWDNRSYDKTVESYDGEDTLIYLDPPYLRETRKVDGGYAVDNSSQEFHEEVLSVALNAKGKVAISGYPSSLYEEHLADWRRVEWQTKATAGSQKKVGKNVRTEVVWMNYREDKEVVQSTPPRQETLL